MRPAIFTIDTFGAETFDGFTQDEDWNGWACPYFTLDQGKRIAEVHRRRGLKAMYDEDNDCFIFNFEDGTDEFYGPLETEGQKLYPIGASNWIWEEAATNVA